MEEREAASAEGVNSPVLRALMDLADDGWKKGCWRREVELAFGAGFTNF